MSVWKRILPALIMVALLQQFVCAQPVDIRRVYQAIAHQKEASDALKSETAQVIQLKKGDLGKRLKALQKEKQSLQKLLKKKQADLNKRHHEYLKLEADQQSDHELMTNLTAAVRVSARQLQELLVRSPYTALDAERPERMDEVLDADHFPGLDDMQSMAKIYFNEIEQTGKVISPALDYRNKAGRHQQGSVLLVGPFLAAVNGGDGFELLQYNDSSRSFSAVAAQFPWRLGRMLDAYLDGESDSVPLDLSAGAALEQLTRRKTLRQRIEEGGVLVWPILLLAVVAILIGIERMIFLKRVHDNTDRTMNEVHRFAAEDDWEACQGVVEGCHSPVYNVVRAGLLARHENREVLESILQEAILKELPRLERALPLLNIMGAVAPLLGLLGTVTGMIGTFEVINIYGTGDPRMMSGGISVALVTTMLGLTVAIPIMLLHTFLNRQVEHIIGDMEEKSVTLTNVIHRCHCGRPRERAA